MTETTTREIVLSSISYFIHVVGQSVVFTASRPVAFVDPDRFMFEKPDDINNSPGTWKFRQLSPPTQPLQASHVIAGHAYCVQNFGDNFEPFQPVITVVEPSNCG